MKLVIERPEWMGPAFAINISLRSEFDSWFTKNVEPINVLLNEGVAVYDSYDKDQLNYWSETKDPIADTRTALLINIQEIKPETPSDVLRDFVKKFHPDNYENDDDAFDLVRRAKKALGDIE